MRMNVKVLSFSVTLLFLAAFQLNGQEYKTAIGARLGSPLSASIKYFMNESNALEGYIGFRSYSFYNWLSISGAYQVHKPIKSAPGLQYYFGGGASFFIWSFDEKVYFGQRYSSSSIGIQGYLGLDYTFEDAPVSLTIDWIPTYFIGTNFISGFGAGYGSLGVRYILSRG